MNPILRLRGAVILTVCTWIAAGCPGGQDGDRCSADTDCPTDHRCVVAENRCVPNAEYPCTTRSDCLPPEVCDPLDDTCTSAQDVTGRPCTEPPECPEPLTCGADIVQGSSDIEFAVVCIVPPGTGGLGDPCTRPDDCASRICINGMCAEPCDPQQGCLPGYDCVEAGTYLDPLEGSADVCVPELSADGLEVWDLGEFAVPQGSAPTVAVWVPEEAVSLTLLVEGLDSTARQVRFGVANLEGPAGHLIGAVPTDAGNLVRSGLNRHVGVVQVPNTPDVADLFLPGLYTFTPYAHAQSDYQVAVRALVKHRPGGQVSSGVLDLNIYLVSGSGYTAATASTDSSFQQMLTVLQTILSRDANIVLGDIVYRDINDASLSTVDLDLALGDVTEFGLLFDYGSASTNHGVDLFVVYQLRDRGTTIGGIAGSVPGPATLHAMATSGVVIRSDLLPDFPAFIGDIAAHELGHYLGLWHNTEGTGTRHDPVSDTKECPASCDTTGDGYLQWEECDDQPHNAPECRGPAKNLMFWATGATGRTLTPGQAFVLLRNPLVR